MFHKIRGCIIETVKISIADKISITNSYSDLLTLSGMAGAPERNHLFPYQNNPG